MVKSARSFSKNLRTEPFSRICKYFNKTEIDKLKTKEVKRVSTGQKESMLEVIDKYVFQGTSVAKSISRATNNDTNATLKGLDGEF